MTNVPRAHGAVAQPARPITVDGATYERIPVKVPEVVPFGEKLEVTLKKYLMPFVVPGDWIAVSEKLVSISQNLVRHISTVKVGWLARFITLGVKKHKNMTAWSRPEKMQVAIEIVGAPRMILAAAVGAVGKLVGHRGWFWIVAGHRVSEIDGFIPEDMYPYTEWGVLPPPDPQGVCDEVERELGVPCVTGDMNFIDVQILGASKGVGLEKRTVKRILIDNPLGQGNKMTPFCVVRKIR